MKATAWVLGALLLGTYGFFHHAGGFNQNVRFDLTRAIVEQGTLTIDAFHTNTLDKAVRDGHYYCDKPPGVSLLGVPPYWVVHRAVRPSGDDAGVMLGFYAARVTAVSLLACGLVVVFLHLVARYRSPADAVFASVALGLGTLVFPYATVFYGHVVAGALVFVAFAAAFLVRRAGWSERWLVAAGLAAGVAIAAEYQVALVVALLGLYAVAGAAPIRRGAAFALGAVAPLAGLAVYHTVCFGSPLATGFVHEALPYWQQRYGAGVYGLSWPRGAALYQLTLGPWRGLFRQAPWLLLAVPGVWQLARRRGWWHEAALVTAAFAVMLLLNASLQSWEGGWTMGARYLIPVVPLLAFAGALAEGRVVRVLGVLLVVPSILFMLGGAAVMPEVPVIVADPLRDFLLPRLLSGDFPVANPAGSAVNLGQLAGLRGLWSLVPLAVLWAGGGAALALAARREGHPRALTARPSGPTAPAAPSRRTGAA